MSGHPLVVVGIGHDGPAGLSAEARAHVEAARVLAGGRRHLEFFPQWQGEKVALGGDVAAFVGTIREKYRHEKTVVLASGDPLFYGIGRALLEAVPRDDLVFLPHLSSVQLAFARIKEPWEDACIVSVHGRPLQALLPALRRCEQKIAVLTDARNSPAAIGAFLCENGCAAAYHIAWVCENLGGPDERVTPWTPRELESGKYTFSPLNIVILLRLSPLPDGGQSLPLLGIPEQMLRHRTRHGSFITRREIRLLSLCYLELRSQEVLWDVGAGSGSVSIEAACFNPTLEVFAIEKDEESYRNLEENVRTFGVLGVHPIAGTAPEVFAPLPDPDAVFIGGSGGRLAEILATVVERLKPDGRIVLNCITLENFFRGWERLCELRLTPEATSVQLAHSRPLGRLHSLEPDNPIFIVRARKP